MKSKIIGVIFIALQFISQSCNTTEPVLVNENIKLTEIDAAVIETYLNIHVENPSPGKEVVLERNEQRVMSFTANKADTAITDTGLTENTLYTYKAKLTEKSKIIGESSDVGVRTMQQTSHNFSWQTFTFGEPGAGSSSLYDVSIINENNIWAVGEIYLNDSLGRPDPSAYNSAHWDGNKWELKRIKYYGSCSAVEFPPLKAIWAFLENSMAITNGGSIGWFNGNTINLDCRVNPLLTGAINKIWGTSSKNLYIVGNNGNIAHYNGTSWQKIDSGTDWDIYDVFGYTNSVNSQEEIICALTDPNNYSNSTLLKITGKTKVGRINLTTGRLTGSAWTNKGFPIYTTGDGIFTNKSGKWEEIKLPVNYTTSKIRGNGLNDIFLCGVLGLVAHYNGKEWKVYNDVYNAVYTSVHLNGNIAAFVGWRDGKGVITIGRRN
ncbi:MAG: glucosyl transferase [Melioribacteraceae bacterium]